MTSFLRSWCLPGLMLGGFLILLGGCGSEEESPCADNSCAYGVCDSETGDCRNPDTCEPAGGGDAGRADLASDKQCLRGFICAGEKQGCVPEIPCEEGSCDRGVCRKGACVNARPCESAAECLAGLGCSDAGRCRDLCADKDCERGVCNPETGACENPDRCAPEDPEVPECLKTAVCKDGDGDGRRECLGEEAYCETLACERGTCSFEARQCIDRETCTADADCVSGHYCDTSINECKTNACAEDGTCPRGECDPATGECVNPSRCEASDECLPAYRCVENRCVSTGEECGPAGCPGHQVCQYDASSLSASCVENPDVPCRNAVDCTGNSVCRNGKCVSPQDCRPDDLEPNDSTQVSFLDNSFNGTVTANLCGSDGSKDVDRYAFDLEAARGDAIRGELYLDLEVARTHVGQGTATLTVTDQSGRILGQQSTGPEGRIHMERPVTALEMSSLQFKVSGSDLGPAGLGYRLFAGVAPESIVRACRDAPEIVPDDERGTPGLITGHTAAGAGREMNASCVQEGPSTAEKLYTFKLEERSYVSLVLRPESEADLTVSLRRYCGSFGSEIACSNVTGAGGAESVGRALRPGKYSVVVQGARPGERGPFQLSFEAEPIVCNAYQDRCTGPTSALICRENGTTVESVDCETSCDMQTGRCDRRSGDVCYKPVDVGNQLSTKIDWTKYTNTFEPSLGCVGDSKDTGGPDVVYQIDVPSGEVLEAKMDFNTPAGDGALYLQKNCADPAGTCLRAADSDQSEEHLTYFNSTPGNQTLYLVADSKAGTSLEETDFSVSTKPPVCEPGASRCSGSTREVCNGSGTGYDSIACTYGCSQGRCEAPPFDTCGGAVNLTGGGTASAAFKDLQRDYDVGPGCAGDHSPGPDAVYRVDLQAGEVLTADVTAKGKRADPMVYVVENCSSPAAVEASCQRGVDDAFEGGDETMKFRAPDGFSGTQSYWVVVDHDGSSGDGAYELSVSTQQSTCTPGERKCASGSLDVIETCGQFGLQFDSFACQGADKTCQPGGATDATCPDPTGDQCADPIPLSKNGRATGVYDGSNQITIPEGTVGACEIQSGNATDGPETIYSVSLEAGDLLTADLETSHDDSMLYVMRNCVVPNSCRVSNLSAGGDQSIRYLADQQETVFVVVGSTVDSGQDYYELDLSTTANTTCIPDSISCTGGADVSICNGVGTAYRSTFSCGTVCRAGACRAPGVGVPGALPQNACGTAPNVGGGTVVSGDWSRLTNSVDLPADACGNQKGAGHDAVYAVSMTQGQVLNARLESFGNDTPYLYLLESCANLNACSAGEVGRDGTAQLTYSADANQTIYVVADSLELNPDDKFRLAIERLNPVCSPGTRKCAATGKSLRFCMSHGLYQSVECEGGCQSGSCSAPGGDWCPDARPVSVGSSISGSFGDLTNTIDLERTPACGIHVKSDASSGPDAIFEVTGVTAGETLVADLETSLDEVNMYVMSACPLGDESPADECEWGVSDTDRLTYRVASAGPLLLAVDTQSPQADADFSLDLSSTTGDVCQPGGGTCTGGTGSLEVCADDGSAVDRVVTCEQGCSKSGYCQTTGAPDTCATAMSVGGGTRLRDTTGRFTADFAPVCASNASGKDAVYSVDVPAGEAMQAVVTPVDGGMDPTVYALPTCSSSTSCRHPDSVSNKPWQTRAAVTGYYNGTAQQQSVAVIVDHGGDGGEYELDVEVGPPECSAGSQGQTTCLDGETLGTCTDYRMYRPSRCDFGCDSSTQACEPVPNDSCGGAVSITGDASYRADIASYTDDYNPAAGSGPCAGSGPGGGPDAVYKVQLNQGDVLDAALRAPADPILWVTSDCSMAAASCEALADAGGTEELTFTAPSSGTYYVIVDTNASSVGSPSGRYLLEVDHAGPPVCTPGSRSCGGPNGDRITYCQPPGLNRSGSECAGTCSSGECTLKHGDFCEDAVTASDGDSFTYKYTEFAGDYTLSASSCVGYETAGNERVFEVELQPGETLSVSANSQRNNDWVQAYVVSECGREARVADSCQTGADFGGASGTLNFKPSISSAETYFVVIDGWLSDTAGEVTVDFSIQ